jgi:hypothetical protein
VGAKSQDQEIGEVGEIVPIMEADWDEVQPYIPAMRVPQDAYT